MSFAEASPSDFEKKVMVSLRTHLVKNRESKSRNNESQL